MIDREGGVVLPPTYDAISRYGDGAAIVTLDGKQGMINDAGECVLELRYDDILGGAGPGAYFLRRHGLVGLARNDGTVLAEPTYTQLVWDSDDECYYGRRGWLPASRLDLDAG